MRKRQAARGVTADLPGAGLSRSSGPWGLADDPVTLAERGVTGIRGAARDFVNGPSDGERLAAEAETDGQAAFLSDGQQDTLAAEVLTQDPVLLPEILDDLLLRRPHPCGHHVATAKRKNRHDVQVMGWHCSHAAPEQNGFAASRAVGPNVEGHAPWVDVPQSILRHLAARPGTGHSADWAASKPMTVTLRLTLSETYSFPAAIETNDGQAKAMGSWRVLPAAMSRG